MLVAIGGLYRKDEFIMRNVASLASIIVGIVKVVAGVATWFVISSTLASQRISVCRRFLPGGRHVNGPFSAYCQASVIDEHTMKITGGSTYAELDRDDPNRATAMNSALLQASLFTSVVAFGVALMAFGVGAVLALIGFALRSPVGARAPSEASSTT